MRMTRDFRLGAGVLGAELVLSGIYFLFPSSIVTQDTIYEIFGGGCVAAILWSVLRRRPSPQLPWLVFASGTALFVAGDIAFDFSPNASQPAVADYLYLIAYPLFAAVPLMLIVRSGSHRRIGALMDAAIVTLAFVVFEWIFVMEPNLHACGPLGPRIVAGALYPVMDIVLLGAFAGFFVSPAWRTPAFAFLVLGASSQLVGDTANRINGSMYSGGAWINWPWMASYIFWTAAVLHPSMRRLGQRSEEPETRLARWRLVALAGALLAVPVARVIADNEHKKVGIWVLAALQTAIALLVVARMGAIVDTVDRIRARLAQKNEELVQADLLKDEFIALVSHDLRTPLTSIIGYVELALDDEGAPLDEERRRYIEVVARSSDRLIRLVDDLLLAARLQSGRFMLNVDDTDLESIAAEALDEMHARAERKGVSLFLAGDGAVRVECDRRRVLQLLDNLVSNAIKFTPEGGRVEIRVERTLTGAAVEVCDTGVGIGAGEEERVFERFYRSASAVSDQVPGTGLGLFIARAIAERHGGRLAVRHRDGGGTILRLELPARAVAASAEPELVA
jgi:signal transduction histidine kinase